jgi:hypothetical protein
MKYIGYIFVAFAAADFLAGNFGKMNLTYFLGSVSQYSPIIFGLIGAALINFDSK